MTQLILPDELYRKLAHGAAKRGVSIESLLSFVSDLFATPDSATKRDRELERRIESLFAKYRDGELTERDRAELDHLIDNDYQEAIAHADRLIASKRTSKSETKPPCDSSPRSSRRSRK